MNDLHEQCQTAMQQEAQMHINLDETRKAIEASEQMTEELMTSLQCHRDTKTSNSQTPQLSNCIRRYYITLHQWKM